ncbi:MAG: ferrochelatase [Cuniculiplasma sp.]
MKTALLMMAYGSPERKEDIMEYLRDVYGGNEPPAFAVDETNSKYSKFGYRSPSSDIIRTFTAQIRNAVKDMDVFISFKHWKPGIDEVVRSIEKDNYERIFLLPLFPIKNSSIQNSYIDPFNNALIRMGFSPNVVVVNGMMQAKSLTEYWIKSLRDSYREGDMVLFTAHSLPHTVEQEREYHDIFRDWSEQIAKASGVKDFAHAFQSKGSYGKTWLEPSIYQILDSIESEKYKEILTVPIGFIYDHLEVLYDLDYLFSSKVIERGMKYRRVGLPNNSPLMVRTIQECVELMKNE